MEEKYLMCPTCKTEGTMKLHTDWVHPWLYYCNNCNYIYDVINRVPILTISKHPNFKRTNIEKTFQERTNIFEDLTVIKRMFLRIRRDKHRLLIKLLRLFWAYIRGTYYFTILLLYYLLTTHRNPFCFSENKEMKKDKLFQYYRHWPWKVQHRITIHKLIEGSFFSKIDIDSESLEIGPYDGAVSCGHFQGKKILFGCEYTPGAYNERVKQVIQHYIGGTLEPLPFASGVFNTVLLVHIFDHIQDDALTSALQEINRVMKTGARMYFSTFDSEMLVSNKMNPDRQSEPPTNWNQDRITWGNFNLHSKEKWIEILNKSGFKVERYLPFLGYIGCDIRNRLSKIQRCKALCPNFLKPSLYKMIYTIYKTDHAYTPKNGYDSFFCECVKL